MGGAEWIEQRSYELQFGVLLQGNKETTTGLLIDSCVGELD